MPNEPFIPEDGEWPCQTEPGQVSERMVAVFYQLLRDHVQPGDLEQVCINVRDYVPLTVVKYTNPHLEALARALVTYLAPPLPPAT